ncbi:MAG: amidohydrolase family protein [Planctomycetota bacterium]
MKTSFVVDAHLHVGLPGVFFAPRTDSEQLLWFMDNLNIQYSVCTDQLSVLEGCRAGIEHLRQIFEKSAGRIYYLGVFHPKYAKESISILKKAVKCAGFAGLKIHPSLHHTFADDDVYESAWQFAAEHDVAILTHSWSVSDYNPVQKYSTPLLFEKFVRKFPQVRFVLGHFGGRGTGRHEAVRMVNDYPNVYGDFAGDIFDYELIENLVKSAPAEKILFGSDFPWLDPRAHLSRVLLADIDDSIKRKILRDNAICVYKVGEKKC